MTKTPGKIGRRGGFMLLDIITGIVVGMAVLVALTVSVQRYRHASRRLADQRAAIHLAERVLTDLQAGRPPASEQEGLKAQVVDLTQPQATANSRWVEVRVDGPGVFVLTGVVPVRQQEGPR
jgi:hypothetical protein